MCQPKQATEKFLESVDGSESNLQMVDCDSNGVCWRYGDKKLGTLRYYKVDAKRHRWKIDYSDAILKEMMNEDALKMVDLNEAEPGDIIMMHPNWWRVKDDDNKIINHDEIIPNHQEGIPTKWKKVCQEYGRIEAKSKKEAETDKEKLIAAFNYDLKCIQTQVMEQKKIIDIPIFQKEARAPHRIHYMVKHKEKYSPECSNAVDDFINDINTNNPCKICRLCWPNW